MVTIPISAAFRGAALVRAEALIKGEALGHPKVWGLFEARR